MCRSKDFSFQSVSNLYCYTAFVRLKSRRKMSRVDILGFYKLASFHFKVTFFLLPSICLFTSCLFFPVLLPFSDIHIAVGGLMSTCTHFSSYLIYFFAILMVHLLFCLSLLFIYPLFLLCLATLLFLICLFSSRVLFPFCVLFNTYLYSNMVDIARLLNSLIRTKLQTQKNDLLQRVEEITR